MSKNGKLSENRIELIDEIRGLCVFCMILYHTFFILDEMFGVEAAEKLFDFFAPVEPFFAGVFIFICGLCCNFSHSNIRRGLIVLGVGIGFTIATCVIMPEMGYYDLQIYFGILHFLGVGILICALIMKSAKRLNPYIGILFCVALYPFFSTIENGYLSYGELFYLNIPDVLYTSDILMPFGIYSPSFFSGDYFPIFPSIFIMLSGLFAGRILSAKGYSHKAKKKHIPFLGALGRKALIIYIVHMPLIYVLACAAQYLFRRF